MADQRFEIDGADAAYDFLNDPGRSDAEARNARLPVVETHPRPDFNRQILHA